MNRLDACLAFVLRWEGGFVNDPTDPGGATNYGVTQATYDAWLARRGVPPQPVRKITSFHIEAIYRADYWAKVGGDALGAPLDLVVFDAAVNCGVDRASRWLQGACGATVDGAVGPKTLAAVKAADARALAEAVCGAREAHYRHLAEVRPPMAKFLKGWLRRLDAVRGEIGRAAA